jgi:signal transduction histidine kinase
VFFSTKGSKGTGLGLFIADKIIRQHDGTIVVDSAVGREARFGIMIPRRASRGEMEEAGKIRTPS